MAHSPLMLAAQDWHGYRLLDSGAGRKLEAVGGFRFIRPEPQALWQPALNSTEWAKADGEFAASSDDKNAQKNAQKNNDGKWHLTPQLPEKWLIRYDNLAFYARPTPFRHFGFFPEQSSHWHWCAARIKRHIAHGKGTPNILNLFGYSGVASLHAARAGGQITHVDSSKQAISLAFDNRACAEMTDAPIRFITEDARKFVAREARRGKQYHGIILDPPKYGRGTKGEIWRIEEDLAPLIADIRAILAPDALFVVVTTYAIRSSFLSLHHLLESVLGDSGQVESGELVVSEANPRGFAISQAIFARWGGRGRGESGGDIHKA